MQKQTKVEKREKLESKAKSIFTSCFLKCKQL